MWPGAVSAKQCVRIYHFSRFKRRDAGIYKLQIRSLYYRSSLVADDWSAIVHVISDKINEPRTIRGQCHDKNREGSEQNENKRIAEKTSVCPAFRSQTQANSWFLLPFFCPSDGLTVAQLIREVVRASAISATSSEFTFSFKNCEDYSIYSGTFKTLILPMKLKAVPFLKFILLF